MDREIHKTALGAEDMVKIESAEDLKALLLGYKDEGFKIIGLENNIKKEILRLNDPSLKEKIGKKCVLILGEEVEGISPELFDLIDIFVEIPMKGKKESFNVSVAAGIALYALN